MDTSTAIQSSLPPDFQFSQSSLQALVDCPRLFQLCYIQQLPWPAPEAEPSMEYEIHQQLGQTFHHMVHQYLLGIDPEKLSRMANLNARLADWWRNFLENLPGISGYAIHPEVTFSIPLEGFRLMAKFDLLAINSNTPGTNLPPGCSTIYDWKTTRNLPKRPWQEKRLQSRVYPYVLVKAGSQLLKATLEPDHVEMVYWFTNFPTAPMTFRYDQIQYEADDQYLRSLINAALNIGKQEAPKTQNFKRCGFCIYRALCNRGITAGSLYDDSDELIDQETLGDLHFEFNFEHIAEIDF